jgi:type II secretory pathway pseudopilin PulG
MTLIELVIGIAITGLMAAVGAGAFATIIDNRQTIRRATEDTERAAALRETMRTWIVSGTVRVQAGGTPGLASSSVPSGSRTTSMSSSGFSNTGVTAAVSSGDELLVDTHAPTPANVPLTRMRLFIDADQSTPESGLTMEYQANVQSPLQRRQLEPAVGGMKVEFLDSLTGRWYGASEAATLRARIAVRVTLLPQDKGTLPALLQLPLLLRLGQQQ